MKKRILVLAAILGASASFAQVTTLKNKKGFEILPEAGDYAIQFNATPMLDFAVEAIKMGATNGTSAAGASSYAVNQTVVGKYFVDASTAYRVKVGINTNSTTTKVTSVSVTDADKSVLTTTKSKQNLISIGGGIEKRRGHNRLQGFYGAEAMITIGSLTPLVSTEYDQDLATIAQDADLNTLVALSTNKQKGSAFGFGLNGFVGAEYFVLPKISLGAEFGWGLAFNTGKTSNENDTWNGTEVVSTTTDGPKQSTFGFANSVSGNLVATFHF
jgi:hypothetical protein